MKCTRMNGFRPKRYFLHYVFILRGMVEPGEPFIWWRKYKERKPSLYFFGIVSNCTMQGTMQVENGCLLLLWKLLLVWYCAGNCSCFFSVYCITSFSDYTHLRHQETTQKFKHETPLFLYCWIHILKFSGAICRSTKKLQYNSVKFLNAQRGGKWYAWKLCITCH